MAYIIPNTERIEVPWRPPTKAPKGYPTRRQVLEAGTKRYYQLPAFACVPQLSGTDRCVFAFVVQGLGPKGNTCIWYSYAVMAERLAFSVSGIKKSVAKLCKLGFLTKVGTGPGGVRKLAVGRIPDTVASSATQPEKLDNVSPVGSAQSVSVEATMGTPHAPLGPTQYLKDLQSRVTVEVKSKLNKSDTSTEISSEISKVNNIYPAEEIRHPVGGKAAVGAGTPASAVAPIVADALPSPATVPLAREAAQHSPVTSAAHDEAKARLARMAGRSAPASVQPIYSADGGHSAPSSIVHAA